MEEVRLYELALKRQWPIPQVVRDRVVKRLREVINDKNSSPREVTAACRALISADQTSLQAVATAVAARQQTELAQEQEELKRQIEEIKASRGVNP